MADTQQDRPKGSAGSYAWLWMILALVSVGGFLTWLGMTAEPTSVAVVEEEDEGAIMDPPSVTVVPKDTLAANKAAYVAQQIRVHNVAATGDLGDQIFWGELGDRTTQVPILIRLDSAAAAGFDPQPGAQYSVRGRVFPMTDSLASAWGDQGMFYGEGEETQAAFTDYYMQVSDVRPTPARLRSGTGPAADTAGMGGDTTGTGTSGGATGEGASDAGSSGAAGESGASG